MEGSWGEVLAVWVILAQLTASGSSYQIIEGPQNVTVQQGSKARFNCTVTHGWKLIMWTLNGVVVLSLTSQEPIITNDRFISESYNRSDSFISEMIILDVQPSDSGLVKCSLQNSNVFGSAFLSVQGESAGGSKGLLRLTAVRRYLGLAFRFHGACCNSKLTTALWVFVTVLPISFLLYREKLCPTVYFG